jgi:mannitol-1-phosphate 5-dehydrogenase
VRKLVQYGAGNIGRSFVAQLFSRAGWEVVFLDIDDRVIQALNTRRRYKIEVKEDHPEEIWVEGVRGVNSREPEAACTEIAEADLLATAVGPGALPHIFPVIARGLQKRLGQARGPLDIIICENVRRGAALLREGLARHLPGDFPLAEMAGLVETSIGKMVPLMPERIRAQDPLLVYAEAYNTLIVDRKGFLNPVPAVPGLEAKDNMEAHVDRKLLVHNLGHAAIAYVGFLKNPSWQFVWQAADEAEVEECARRAMTESGRALVARYPEEFDEADQYAHIEQLLRRFHNRALGDTLYRVGRDLPRKLSREDRLIGALLTDAEFQVDAPFTTLAAAAAFFFDGRDERGELFPADRAFHRRLKVEGLDVILSDICGLDEKHPAERALRRALALSYSRLLRRSEDWLAEALAGGRGGL